MIEKSSYGNPDLRCEFPFRKSCPMAEKTVGEWTLKILNIRR
jgi:hypothetical protein